MRGVCLDAMNPVARPTAGRLARMGLTGVRLVAFAYPEFLKYANYLTGHGLDVAVLLTGSSFPDKDYAGWTRFYQERLNKVALWLVGNEFNIQGAASWPLLDFDSGSLPGSGPDSPPGGDFFTSQFQGVWGEIVGALKELDDKASCWVGGLFSQPGLAELASELYRGLTPKPDGVDLHPYMESLEEIVALLLDLERRKVPTGVFEWNWNDPSWLVREERVLELGSAHSAWIPWDSNQLLPEKLPGLVRGSYVTKLGKALRGALTAGKAPLVWMPA